MARSHVPEIVSLDAIATMPRMPPPPAILHLTSPQLEALSTETTPRPPSLPRVPAVVVKPVPGGGALVFPVCRPRPNEVCDYRLEVTKGPIGESPQVRVVCSCSAITRDRRGPPLTVVGSCSVVFSPLAPHIRCMSVSCRKACRPLVIQQPNGSFLALCACT